jgi:hypothetical protein
LWYDTDATPTPSGGVVNEMWLDVYAFSSAAGGSIENTTLGVPGVRTPVWALDASTNEAVAAVVMMPASWSTMHVDILWGAATASGDVYWRTGVLQLDVGDVWGTTEVTTNIGAVAQTGADRVVMTRLHSNLAITARFFRLEVMRVGADAGDTLVGDVGFVGAIFTKAS